MVDSIKRVVVLLGGNSSEREVSLVSGQECAKAISGSGYEVFKVDTKGDFIKELENLKPDVVFNALHGRGGEDGAIQGVLEMLKFSYTHSGILASSVAMNKDRAKTVFRDAGLPVTDHFILKKDLKIEEIPYPFPYVLKPISGGSSLDVHIISCKDDWLKNNILDTERASNFMIEPFIPGRELTVTVMGKKALAVTDIVSDKWYDYDAKYETGGSKHILPARIPKDIQELCLSYSLAAHNALGCRGVSRIDLRWNEMHHSDGLFILELNTQPGMTPTSLVPEQAKYVGIPFEKLCTWLINDASCDR